MNPQPEAVSSHALHVNIANDGATLSNSQISVGNIAGRDVIIHQYFTEGLARLVSNYSTRIENFLAEYLGDDQKHVPFGGRQQQLDELDAWLADATAPPYTLLVAEAGGGKSALVARWCNQVVRRGDWEVIFVPISIRFQTAAQDVFFAALAARLANFYEDSSTLPPAMSGEQAKGQCESYLRRPLPPGKQLLVVLDGLDEATGWAAGPELFAKRPPAGLRILVTARLRTKENDIGNNTGSDAGGWADTLGWKEAHLARKIRLPGLTRQGVAEALHSMGNPLDRLATQVDVVGELHRLSRGDPLLVRLYVDRLAERDPQAEYLHPEELAQIEPGLDAFMDRWWADQRKQWQMQGKDDLAEEERLLPLLNVCTVAFGPLLLKDLAALDGGLFGKGLLVSHMVERIGRWVIGDGQKQGYVFGHPRLRDYFGARMGEAEHREWQDKFCAWGERVLNALNGGTLDPKVTPEYLLRYYATHLQEANAPATRFYALISNGWRLAWECLDVSYGGFLNDVDRAWQKAKQGYEPQKAGKAVALVQQIKAALCQASVAALGNNMPPELLAQAVKAGLRTPVQALAIIKQIPDEQQRSLALREISALIPDDLIKDAWVAADTIKDKRQRIVTLCAFVERFPQSEKIRRLEEILRDTYAIDNEHDLAIVLCELSSHLTTQLRLEVLKHTRCIVNQRYRAYALSAFAQDLSKTELSYIIKMLLKDGQGLDKIGLADSSGISLLERFAADLPIEFLDEALESIYKIGYSPYRFRALKVWLPYLPEDRRMQIVEAELTITLANNDRYFRPCMLGSLASWLSEAQRKKFLDNSLITGIAHPGSFEGTLAIVEIAPYLSSETYKTAVEIVFKTEYEEVRAVQLRSLLPYLSMELLTETFHRLKQVNDLKSLSVLSPRLSREMLESVLQATATINDLKARQYILAELLIDLPVERHSVLMDTIITLTAEGHSPFDSRRLVVRLVPCLSGQELINMLDYHLGYLPQGFIEVAPNLPKRELRKLLEFAASNVASPSDLFSDGCLV